MAAYSIRSDRPFIVKGPLKVKTEPGEHRKEMREYFRTHSISITRDSSGNPVVIANEIEDDMVFSPTEGKDSDGGTMMYYPIGLEDFRC